MFGYVSRHHYSQGSECVVDGSADQRINRITTSNKSIKQKSIHIKYNKNVFPIRLVIFYVFTYCLKFD